MNSRDAAELLRATQIAGAMLKPEKKMLQPAKGKPAEALALTPKRNGVNAVEISALTPWKKGRQRRGKSGVNARGMEAAGTRQSAFVQKLN